jgi:ABC-type sugar transport system ATPase subunit
MPADAPAIATRGLSKRFPGVHALDNIDLEIRPAEVHALVGQNGAGKSTLINILSGALAPSDGQIFLQGRPARFGTPLDAISEGIAAITQEISLVPTLSAGENILLGRLPSRGAGRVDWGAVHRQGREILSRLGFDIDPRALVGRLTIAQQQGVEIARALSREAAIVIMDEPTSALAVREVERLLQTIVRLRENGTSIIYVSHRMDEVFRISDRISVLREGRLVGSLKTTETSQDEVVRLMVGREVRSVSRRVRRVIDTRVPVLEVRSLTREGVYHDISFKLYPGEILAISGLVGAGRTEIVRGIFGADQFDSGTVSVAGVPVERPYPERMIALGVGLVPEDRRNQGLVLGMSVVDNLSLVRLARRPAYRLRQRSADRTLARQLVDRLGIRAPGLSTPAATLSGGNQQKIVIGKWLGGSPRVVIFDEPTRGIDIDAKAEVLSIIQTLADSGVAVIVISSEQAEILQVSDRVLVIREGRIIAELDPSDASEEILTQAVFGTEPRHLHSAL